MFFDKRQRSRSPRQLLLLLSSYIFLMALLMIFSVQIMKRIGLGDFNYINIILPISLIIPLVLLIMVIYNITRFIKERQNAPGSRLRLKIIFFFTVIVLLSTTPQAVLSVYTIVNAYKSWYSPDIGSALNSGLYISLVYYHDVINNLNTIPQSQEFTDTLEEIDTHPVKIWQKISSLNPWIHSIQISEGDNSLIFGDSLCEWDNKELMKFNEGMLPKRKKAGISILSYLYPYPAGSKNYYIVLSTILPKDYDIEAENLTLAVDQYQNFNQIMTYIKFTTIILFLFFTLPLILLAVLISVVLTDRIILPINRLAEATKYVADGDFAFFVDAFNTMTNELQRSRTSLVQKEKVSTWQEIARRLAHELKNPLTPIKLTAQRLQRKELSSKQDIDEILKPSLELIIRQVDQLDIMLQDFRYFADNRESRPEWRTVKLFLKDLIDSWQNSHPDIILRFNMEEDDIKLYFDPGLMQQVFQNLFKNAVDAVKSNEEKCITITVNLIQKGFSDYCRICFEDNGIGISEKDRVRIFEPYFTTKQNGLGLGLPITERIITLHNGQIWVETSENTGTSFYIDLPIEDQDEKTDSDN